MSEKLTNLEEVRFNTAEKEYIEDLAQGVAEKVVEKYFSSTMTAIKDMQGGICDYVAETVKPIIDKLPAYEMISNKEHGNEKGLKRVRTWLWLLTLATAGIILAMALLHT